MVGLFVYALTPPDFTCKPSDTCQCYYAVMSKPGVARLTFKTPESPLCIVKAQCTWTKCSGCSESIVYMVKA